MFEWFTDINFWRDVVINIIFGIIMIIIGWLIVDRKKESIINFIKKSLKIEVKVIDQSSNNAGGDLKRDIIVGNTTSNDPNIIKEWFKIINNKK